MREGVAGLLRDKSRPSRRPARSPIGRPPRWRSASASVSVRSNGSGAHGLQPHRWRQLKLSNDPQFAANVCDVVGLYMSPPAHAIVVSIDEKSQIQALDRTQPGLPLKPGRCGATTHDYKRNGTTTLFAALNVSTGPSSVVACPSIPIRD